MTDDTGERPTTPYRSGDLEAAARAARDDAAQRAREAAMARAREIREEAEREAAERDGRARVAPPTARAGAPEAPATDDEPARAGGLAVDSSDEASGDEAGGSDDDRDRNDSSVGAFFRELPVLLAVAFLLAFLLRTFVVQVFYIPSGSMIPTLEINDRIVVEKISYNFRDPERGEIVVFEGDAEPRPAGESMATKISRGVGQFLGIVPANARDFVKRVIGLPGDEIVIEDGVVSVNGVPLDEPYAVEDLRDFGPFLVPEGKLFFLGDNRPSSADSRIESALGYVDRDHVVGRAMVIVWPFDHFDGLGTPEYDPEP